MEKHLVFLSIPVLRDRDLARMPNLTSLMRGGDKQPLTPSFPCVTWPVQTNMLTGKRPAEHGVVANGFYWRESREVEMWTAWNDKIQAPQIWDHLHQQDPQLTSAVWFPMLSKGCGADYVCMPAPIHKPDGSEELWCYSKPTEFYGELLERQGHFPLKHFWGPLAGAPSSEWIVESAVIAATRFRPNFFYIYLPLLDYAAQKEGPDSEAAAEAPAALDALIGKLRDGVHEAWGEANVCWLAASEYVITPVDHVTYPNRLLRAAGLLKVRAEDDGEHLDLEASRAWALVDHQFSHVFVRDGDRDVLQAVEQLFRQEAGIEEILRGETRAQYALDHPRSGDLILISTPNSWQAYYWWLDDALAPAFARTVDIHRKPGYDPAEMHVDMATRSISLDATRVRGSHGAPVRSDAQRGVILASRQGVLPEKPLADVEVAELVLRQFRS